MAKLGLLLMLMLIQFCVAEHDNVEDRVSHWTRPRERSAREVIQPPKTTTQGETKPSQINHESKKGDPTLQACSDLGGKCQSKHLDCDGPVMSGKGYCKSSKKYECCTPVTPTTPAGCPEEDGFFYYYPSGQCYKFDPVNNRDWHAAKHWCESQELKMPHPRDAIGLRSYMWQEWGHKEPWLNLKKEVSPGTNYIWQDNDVIVTPTGPFWFPHEPIYDCVILLAWSVRYAQYPNRPFFTRGCHDGAYFALCEKIMPGHP